MTKKMTINHTNKNLQRTKKAAYHCSFHYMTHKIKTETINLKESANGQPAGIHNYVIMQNTINLVMVRKSKDERNMKKDNIYFLREGEESSKLEK